MVNNNNGIPIEVKKPFEIVQEVNNEIPSYEEFMKKYETDGSLNYDDLNGGGVGTPNASGPCYVCKKSERETYLKVACPVVSCTDRNPKNWYHALCFGSRMKISNRGNLRCEGCSTSGKVGYWRFICSGHGGTPEYTTTGAFRRALGIVLGSDDCDEVITDLGAYIADPIHKDEWFR